MSRSWNHQAYAQMLWGDALNHQVESFIVGMGLMRHSPTSRRILWATDEVRDSGISEILGTIWQSETLQHLNTGLEGAHASRLSKVWTKLKIWEVACCEEVRVCVLLDTDILVRPRRRRLPPMLARRRRLPPRLSECQGQWCKPRLHKLLQFTLTPSVYTWAN